MLGALKTAWQLLDTQSQRHAFILLLLSFVGAVFEAVGVGIVFQILIAFTSPGVELGSTGAFGSDAVREIYLIAKTISPARPEFVLLLGVFVFFLVKNIFLIFLLNYSLGFGWRGRANFSRRLFVHYLSQPYETHLLRNTATILRNLINVVSDLFFKVVMPTVLLTTELLVIAAILYVLAAINLTVTVIATVVLGTSAALYYLLVRKNLVIWARSALQKYEALYLWASQGIGGIKEAKILNNEDYFIKSFGSNILEHSNLQQKIVFYGQLPRYIVEIIAVGSIVIGVLILFSEATALEQTIPIIGVFAAAAFRLLPSIGRIAMHVNNIRAGIPSIAILQADFSSQPDGGQVSWKIKGAPLSFRDKIELSHLSFNYSGADKLVLDDISLEIKKGEAVALVGPSGAGKTTLVDVILGLLEPSGGEIKLDGTRIDTGTEEWGAMFGYVPQDIFLVDGSLHDNIVFGRQFGGDEQGRLAKAVDQAHLAKVVSDQPAGMDSEVGERGARISGGQSQRVGIARALFSEPEILVLDEATSSLDTETESEIVQAIDDLGGKVTVIIITHRLSTVKNCDRIYLMDRGRIIDSGKFGELAERNSQIRRDLDRSALNLSSSQVNI